MSGLYLTEEDIAMLRAYKGDGSKTDKKILEDIVKKYKNDLIKDKCNKRSLVYR